MDGEKSYGNRGGYPVIDYNRVFARIPEIMRLDLALRGSAWEGKYYITGEPHAYKRDKLKVKLHRGIWVYEQGGESLPLVRWLVDYGGCKDYAEAFRTIRGFDAGGVRPLCRPREKEALYVPGNVLKAMRGFALESCPLFRWMAGLFGAAAARAAWERYNVMADTRGNAVYWYVDEQGRICHDKRIPYLDDGHRDKRFGAFRKYRTGDGYTGRCLFGEHLAEGGSELYVCESEKDALVAYLATGKPVAATGGKNNLREVSENMILLPDVDAAGEWESKAAGKCRVSHWWERYPHCGGHDGVGDYLVWWWKNRRAAV